MSYAESKIDAYNRLMKDALSPFANKTMVDIFVYAAVFGFVEGRSRPIKPKERKPQISVVAMTPEQKAVLLTIAIASTGNIDILFKEDEAAEIVEGYANYGIDLLEQKMLSNVKLDAIPTIASNMRKDAKEFQSTILDDTSE